jgi:hypothetical protein
MNALTTQPMTGAALTAWVSNAEQNLAAIPSSRGLDMLKLTKQGKWVFGAKQVELADDDFVAVNPFSPEIGYIAFSDGGELLGEQMVSLASTPLRLDQLPAVAAERGWQKQVALTCQIIEGKNAGTSVVYKTSSVGGLDFAKRLIAEMMAKLKTGTTQCVPILDLQVDSYQHPNKSYGTVYTPQCEIVEWVQMDFDAAAQQELDLVEPDYADPAAPAAATAEPAPRGRGRPKKEPEPASAAPEPGRRMRRT